MKKIIGLFIMALAIYSCGGNSKESSTDAVSRLKELEIIDVNIDTLLAHPSAYAEQTVRFSAMVEHVCKHTGQKLTVMGTLPDKTIKVMATDAIPRFENTLNGAKVEIVGVVKGIASEQAESCETDSTQNQPITYTVNCQTLRTL